MSIPNDVTTRVACVKNGWKIPVYGATPSTPSSASNISNKLPNFSTCVLAVSTSCIIFVLSLMYCGIYSFKYKLLADSFESIATLVSPTSTFIESPAMLTSKNLFQSSEPLVNPLSVATISSNLYLSVLPSSGVIPAITLRESSLYSA